MRRTVANSALDTSVRDPKPGNLVYMVMNGSFRNGVPQIVSFVRSQAEALRNAGWLVCLGVVDNRTSPRGILRNIRRLKGEVANAKPVLVHAQYGSVTAAVANAIRGSLPFVISFCGDDLLGTPNAGVTWRLRSKVARLIGIYNARKAAAIIVKSDNLFDALPQHLRSKALILPNGVDLDFFQPMDFHECRRRLNWSPESRIVLFNASQGEGTPNKNPELARAALSHACTLIPNITMKAMSNSRPEEVRLMLNAADCLLVTSLHEGSPNIVKEAMACNLPVVSVNCGDVAERLRAVRPGAVCNYDAKVLGRAVAEVFKAPLRSNGREQIIVQGLSASVVASRIIEVYMRLLKEHSCVESLQSLN